MNFLNDLAHFKPILYQLKSMCFDLKMNEQQVSEWDQRLDLKLKHLLVHISFLADSIYGLQRSSVLLQHLWKRKVHRGWFETGLVLFYRNHNRVMWWHKIPWRNQRTRRHKFIRIFLSINNLNISSLLILRNILQKLMQPLSSHIRSQSNLIFIIDLLPVLIVLINLKRNTFRKQFPKFLILNRSLLLTRDRNLRLTQPRDKLKRLQRSRQLRF